MSVGASTFFRMFDTVESHESIRAQINNQRRDERTIITTATTFKKFKIRVLGLMVYRRAFSHNLVRLLPQYKCAVTKAKALGPILFETSKIKVSPKLTFP
jgi:hypothetical protein